MKEGLFFTELFCLSFHQLQYCHTAYFPNAQPGSQRIFQQYYATTCDKTLAATQGSESLKHRSWKVNFLVSFQVLFPSLLKTVNQNQNQSVLSARRVLQIVNRLKLFHAHCLNSQIQEWSSWVNFCIRYFSAAPFQKKSLAQIHSPLISGTV